MESRWKRAWTFSNTRVQVTQPLGYVRMDSADDVYIIVRQNGPQGTEDQKLYFKRIFSPFLSRVSFCSAIVVCFTLFITAVDHGTQYIFDMIHFNRIISTNFFLTV